MGASAHSLTSDQGGGPVPLGGGGQQNLLDIIDLEVYYETAF